jgi:hypothetical protein
MFMLNLLKQWKKNLGGRTKYTIMFRNVDLGVTGSGSAQGAPIVLLWLRKNSFWADAIDVGWGKVVSAGRVYPCNLCFIVILLTCFLDAWTTKVPSNDKLYMLHLVPPRRLSPAPPTPAPAPSTPGACLVDRVMDGIHSFAGRGARATKSPAREPLFGRFN